MKFDKKTASAVFLVLVLLGWIRTAGAGRLPDFTELVEENGAAVVNISTTRKIEAPRLPEGIEIPEGSPLEELFRHFFGQQDWPMESKSLGSGFIVSDDGYIVTNYHVVKEADEIIVRLQDRRELTARLIGADKRSDLALLKVEAEDLPVVRLGHSRNLKVGEWVVAIGSPFGFDHSVTAGIVSAKGRSLPGDNYVPFIQTDVAINPGNSGGPLFNMAGEVVGVNSQIYSRTGGFMGLSFAIPIDVALEVIDQLKAHGKVRRGWLGVQIQDVTRELAQSFGMDRPHGALVARVLPGSPAARAGIQVGDVIVAYDGHAIESSAELPPRVGLTPIGREVPVEVLREGRRRLVRVRIGQLPDKEPVQAGVDETKLNVPELGLAVAELGDDEREPPATGVVVRHAQGPAREAGIRPGDVIVRLGRQPIRSVGDLQRRLRRLPPDRPVALLIRRGEDSLFLAVKPYRKATKPKHRD